MHLLLETDRLVDRLLDARRERDRRPLPDAASTFQILPSPQMTIDLPSGIHAYCG